jgi:HEAT repeat protein
MERASRGETSALTALADNMRMAAARAHMPVGNRRLSTQLLATRQPPSDLDLLDRVAAEDPDSLVRAWASVGTLLGGRSRHSAQLAELEVSGEQRHLLAYRALALSAIASPLGPPRTVEALDVVDDSHLRCRLLKALAASGHALALPRLTRTYPDVRVRLCVAQALSEVRSSAATAFILERLKDEPYTTVRAALAQALGRSRTPRATAALKSLFRDETEQLVLTSAARALVGLGLGLPLSRDRELRVPRRARELWVVPRGPANRPVHVRVDGRRQLEMAIRSDRRAPREAYAFALPSARRHRSLRVFPGHGHALFR